jgi:hypothetical protein
MNESGQLFNEKISLFVCYGRDRDGAAPLGMQLGTEDQHN